VEEAATTNERMPLELAEFMRLMLIRAGNWRSFSDVNIGRMFQHFLNEDVRREIIGVVDAVPEARGSIRLQRRHPVFRKIEKTLLARHRDVMVPQPLEDRLFLDGVQVCDFYKDKLLLADPSVSALLDRASHMFRPNGARVRIANAARRLLIRWRRLRKRLKD
jgi:hypothetical protein